MGITHIKQEIEKKLKEILFRRFELNIGDQFENISDEELLGFKWQMSPRHLLYLLFDIEKEFSITIHEEAIVGGKFNTMNNIIDIILSQIQLQKKVVLEYV
jgi:peptide maturation system acyl carrier-related protein